MLKVEEDLPNLFKAGNASLALDCEDYLDMVLLKKFLCV